MKILIDNGHGINTKGKCSPDGRIREYKYCREIASRLCAVLKSEGFDAELLVPEDADIPLGQRCARANAHCDRIGKKNVLLVSIHLNAAGCGTWMNARGWEAWTSPGVTDSDRLAECLYDAARKVLPKGTLIRTDFTDGDSDKEARFAILTGTKCPAVLTENLFQDNHDDVDYLLSEAGKEALVHLHQAGITQYINRNGK